MYLLWDIRVSLDLFLGGLGIGAFLLGALLYQADREAYAEAIKKAFLMAPVTVIAGLLLLMTELGRPINVIKTVYAVNPTSFMSIGIFLQGLFVLVSCIIAFRLITKGDAGLSRALVYIGAALAGLVGFYHGFLLTGIGLEPWNNALPTVFFLSSIVAGSSLALLLSYSQLEQINERFNLPVTLNLALTLELAAVAAWAYHLALASQASKQTYVALMENYGMEFWGLSILLGLIVPIVLLSLILLKKAHLKATFAAASVAIISGSFFLKNLIVYLGQTA